MKRPVPVRPGLRDLSLFSKTKTSAGHSMRLILPASANVSFGESIGKTEQNENLIA